MRHDVTKEVKELAMLTGKTEKELASKYELYKGSDTYEAWNRRVEGTIKSTLAQKKSDAKAEEIKKERISGYRWTKEDGDWVVAGNFDDKKVGDEITVTKASGERQQKIIEEFTPIGNAIVF